MIQIKKICKYHPERRASNKCYYCKEPVCSSCRQLHAHHYFCSKSCYVKWQVEQWFKRLAPYKIYGVLAALVLLSDIGLYILFQPQSAPQVVTPQPDIRQTVLSDSFTVRLDTNRVALQYGFHIGLEVDEESAPVLLWQNGCFVAAIPVEKGKADFGTRYFEPGWNRIALWAQTAQGHAVLLDSFSIYFHSPRLSYLKRQISGIHTKEKILALTFDGGSSDKGTQNILDTLRSRKVHCTMFLTGEFIRRYPELVKEIVAEGHEAGNHSFSHPHLTNLELDGSQLTRTGITREKVWKELLRTDSLFKQTSGESMAALWRAPYGELNNEILLWAAEIGFKHINWSLRCDSWDWVADTSSHLYRNPQEMLDYFLNLESETGLQGRIVLMHLGSERKKDFPYTVLGKFIDTLRVRGYRFVRVSTLLGNSKKVKDE